MIGEAISSTTSVIVLLTLALGKDGDLFICRLSVMPYISFKALALIAGWTSLASVKAAEARLGEASMFFYIRYISSLASVVSGTIMLFTDGDAFITCV
jgi:hypothetical protein